MENTILSRSEIEVFVSNLNISQLDSVGSLSWFENHKRLHMLYQEALLETINNSNETIKETFLLHGKIKDLVYEAICLSVWRLNIFPLLCKAEIEKEKVFPVFVVLYHEATAFGLLESLAFHSDCVESLQDSAVELLDYCVHNILQVINRDVPRVLKDKLGDLSSSEELRHHEATILHNIGLCSVCVLRYIAEAFEILPLGISSRFYNHHDVPMLLCKVLELSPWYTSDLDGGRYQFVDGNWKSRYETGEDEPLNKSEGQIWLCLRQVLLDQRFLQYYEMSDFRRHQLCKLISYLHDELLDQLSPLVELKHWLCQLSVAQVPPPQSRPLILELYSQYREKLLQKHSGNWEKLAAKLGRFLENLDISQIQDIAKGVATAYQTLDLVEPEPPRCANCGQPAARRCSRCKAAWYCGRECQVKQWEKHKIACLVVTP
ncbi:zinc finger MYND domain-containing protein 10-like [Macrosteles quadrilineatus]|uniref:zinc finger MYND domain-containing protein 10-like n=1 Tax=Macrosteles quadrilineatus TaxID=74068 RepID=UPI0023E0B782|nr:zinc finger MYND domain-containing protein 10-like [Macrosteles quadrilineatus]